MRAKIGLDTRPSTGSLRPFPVRHAEEPPKPTNTHTPDITQRDRQQGPVTTPETAQLPGIGGTPLGSPAMACPLTSRKRRYIRKLLADQFGWRCAYCQRPLREGAEDPNDRPTIDHGKPRSKGGRNFLRNLVLACPQCNVRKGDLDLADWLPRCGLPSDWLTSLASHPERT